MQNMMITVPAEVARDSASPFDPARWIENSVNRHRDSRRALQASAVRLPTCPPSVDWPSFERLIAGISTLLQRGIDKRVCRPASGPCRKVSEGTIIIARSRPGEGKAPDAVGIRSAKPAFFFHGPFSKASDLARCLLWVRRGHAHAIERDTRLDSTSSGRTIFWSMAEDVGILSRFSEVI